MKREGRSFSLALTWDGVRWPVKKLSSQAQVFLGAKPAVPARDALSELFQDDRVSELRICWVPQLAGGADVLSSPFVAKTGKRVSFRVARFVPLGNLLGVIYRR